MPRQPPRIVTAEGRLRTLIRVLQDLPRYTCSEFTDRRVLHVTLRQDPDGLYLLVEDVHRAIAAIERADDGPQSPPVRLP